MALKNRFQYMHDVKHDEIIADSTPRQDTTGMISLNVDLPPGYAGSQSFSCWGAWSVMGMDRLRSTSP